MVGGAHGSAGRSTGVGSARIEMSGPIPNSAVTFGIMTAPQQVSYRDILRVWREAETVPQIKHAWLFDHLMPIGGDPNGPIFEGGTLLSALSAHTEPLRPQRLS